VAAGEGDLEPAPGLELAADLAQVRTGRPPSPGTPSVAASPRIARASTSSIRGGAGAVRRSPVRIRSTASPSVSTPITSTPSTSRASSTRGRRPRPAAARAGQRGDHRQDARHGPDLAAERQLADQRQPVRPGPTCSEPSRMPIAIARSSDAPALRRSAGARLTVIRAADGRTPALRSAPRTRSARLLQGGIGQPDDGETRQARRDIDLDPDEIGPSRP
jgi:hypothetical protein